MSDTKSAAMTDIQRHTPKTEHESIDTLAESIRREIHDDLTEACWPPRRIEALLSALEEETDETSGEEESDD